MPIYEFYSPTTHKIYSFFARSLAHANAIPQCPDNPSAEMQRVVSRFAVTGRAKEKNDAGPEDLADPKMERVMAEMEREMGSIDETNPNPKQLARLMRTLTEATGKKVPEEMEHMLRRLEAGEDPEKLEAEFGDALEDLDGSSFDDDSEAEEKPTRTIAHPGRGRPSRDPRLYEMSDYLQGGVQK